MRHTTFEVRHVESGDELVVFVFNHGKSSARSQVAVRVPRAGYRATEVVTAREIPLTRDQD